MKLQFSLTTLLVCLTVSAVVCHFQFIFRSSLRIQGYSTTVFYKDGKPDYQNQIAGHSETITESRPPNEIEIIRRLAWSALGATRPLFGPSAA